jgi:prepilin-type N-terminal cleavage/methylation domain-containing protein
MNTFICGNTLLKLKHVSQPNKAQGYSIIELLIAIVIVSITVLAAGSLIIFAITNIKKSNQEYSVQNAVDKDLSAIEGLADRYYCDSSGACAISATTPSKTDYASIIASSADISQLSLRCNQRVSSSNDLVTPLKSLIEEQLIVPNYIVRTIAPHGADSGNALSKVRHLNIQYSYNGVVIRDMTVTPTIAAYCP